MWSIRGLDLLMGAVRTQGLRKKLARRVIRSVINLPRSL